MYELPKHAVCHSPSENVQLVNFGDLGEDDHDLGNLAYDSPLARSFWKSR